jgi:PAS domain S-box-containing protein
VSNQQRTVLIVDDSAEDRKLYRRYLLGAEDYSYTVIEAQLGIEGLELWQQHQPDITLLDYQLPDLDGLEFLGELSAQQSWLPVILLTGQGNEEIAVQALKAGARDYLIKGQLSPQSLLVAIAKAIEEIELRRQLQQSQERLQLALRASGMGTWDCDMQTGLIQWSENLESLFGLQPGEFDGSYKMFISLVHPEDRDHVTAAVQRAIDTGEDYDIEFRVVYPNGKIRWALSRGKVFYDRQGQPIRMAGTDLDITERKRTEAALRESEEFKSRIVESSSDCIKLLDLEGKLLYINSGGVCLLEIEDCASYINNSVWTDFWQGDEKLVAEAAITAAKQGIASQFQGFCPTARGKSKWWDVVVTPILNSQGRASQILVISRDITKQKQAEEELRQSEERFRTLADNMSQFAWMTDASGWIFWYNQRWFDYTGTTLEEMQGWGWQKVHHPAELERVVEHFRYSIEAGESWEDTFPLRGKDGKYRWFLSRAIPIRDRQGKIVRWFGTNTDIDKLRQTEIELRESEERYRSLAELIPQLVWTAGEDGKILDVNQRWSDFTGLTIEQIERSGWQEVIHPEDVPTLSQHWGAALHSGIYYQAEGRMRRADGAYLWHLHQAIPQKNERGEIVKWFGTATDIEVQKQLEIERDRVLELEQSARAEAERANRIKDEFLAILSHELRSPLNPILGWVQLLQHKQIEPTRMAQGLAIIEKNVRLQTQLIDDLLDVAKILRGKLSLNVIPVNLVSIINSALETISTAATAKSILLNSSLSDIGQVSADPTRLQQIIWNLLSNAIKFTPEGGRVEISLEKIDNLARVTVSDTGKGINPDFLPHLFEYFRQEDSSITRRYGGLGLGLAIVRYLIEAHGGTIAVSSPGKDLGATFTLQLPLLDVQLETKAIKSLEKELDLSGIRILCIDDEPDTLDLLGILLTDSGASVMTVDSAAIFLSAIESFQPDILISDIGMPEIDGYNLIQQVRSLTPERGGQIPAIALTAFAGEINRQQALKVGFQRHLAKPVEPNLLIQAVLAVFKNFAD